MERGFNFSVGESLFEWRGYILMGIEMEQSIFLIMSKLKITLNFEIKKIVKK